MLLYYGRIDKLDWDPDRLEWPVDERKKPTPLMSFTSKLGREILKKKIVVPNPVTRKWSGVLPQAFRLRWLTVWAKERVRKEAGLLWLISHRAVPLIIGGAEFQGWWTSVVPCAPIMLMNRFSIVSGSAFQPSMLGNGLYTF